MVKLTTKTVSIIARLGNTGIQVGPHICEGQCIVVRVDSLMKVFCICFVLVRSRLSSSGGGANGGNVTLPCAQHRVNFRLARELDATHSSKKCRVPHLPHMVVISPKVWRIPQWLPSNSRRTKRITWFPPWFARSSSHWALRA